MKVVRKLCQLRVTTVGTHTNRKMPNYLLSIDILGENQKHIFINIF